MKRILLLIATIVGTLTSAALRCAALRCQQQNCLNIGLARTSNHKSKFAMTMLTICCNKRC